MRNIPKRSKKVSKPRSTKVVVDGIMWDSKHEMEMYVALKANKIPFIVKPKYTIMEGLTYNGKKVQPITLSPDFELPTYDMVIDPKGRRTADNDLKWKMIKSYFKSIGREPKIYLIPQVVGEIDKFIKCLKTNTEYIPTKKKRKKS